MSIMGLDTPDTIAFFMALIVPLVLLSGFVWWRLRLRKKKRFLAEHPELIVDKNARKVSEWKEPAPGAKAKDIQEWFRTLPLMEGFFTGRHAGWHQGKLLKLMHNVQAEAVGAGLGERFVCGAGMPILVTIGCALAGLFVGYGIYYATKDLLVGMPWYVLMPLGAGGLGTIAFLSSQFIRAWIVFDTVYVPFMVIQLETDDIPQHRIVGYCPRLAMFNSGKPYYFGPRGGGALTATHVRFFADPSRKEGQTPTADMTTTPATTIYELKPVYHHAMSGESRTQQALVQKAKRASILRPRRLGESLNKWATPKTFLTAFMLIVGGLSALVIILQISPADVEEIASSAKGETQQRAPVVIPAQVAPVDTPQ